MDEKSCIIISNYIGKAILLDIFFFLICQKCNKNMTDSDEPACLLFYVQKQTDTL